MSSPMNAPAFQHEEEIEPSWEEALDWLFWELELCECDPPEDDWQVGYEAALRDMFSKLIGRDPSCTLH
jgi:hypothetical protein